MYVTLPGGTSRRRLPVVNNLCWKHAAHSKTMVTFASEILDESSRRFSLLCL